jgi:hypothetical protein
MDVPERKMQEGIALRRLRCPDCAATNLFSLYFYGMICDKSTLPDDT